MSTVIEKNTYLYIKDTYYLCSINLLQEKTANSKDLKNVTAQAYFGPEPLPFPNYPSKEIHQALWAKRENKSNYNMCTWWMKNLNILELWPCFRTLSTCSVASQKRKG